jgi:signal transduction histidine kinase
MSKRISLRIRLFLIIAGLIVITVIGGCIMMWYTYQMDGLFKGIIDRDLAALRAAEALENALMNQKGFVSYYFLDGNPDWLKKLGEYRQAFRQGLKKVRNLALTQSDMETVDQIELEYTEYIKNKDEVIALYKAGDREAGAELHRKVRTHFFKILDLCQGYKNIYNKKIDLVRTRTHTQARRLRLIAGTAVWTAVVLGALLAFVLVVQVLNPLRRLAQDKDGTRVVGKSGDEVEAVSHRLFSLIEDVDHTKSELERSQEHLLQTEKLAAVGRLAAGMAHSIRNPLTSVKMRLFSMGRTLDLSTTQEEDFDVISEEIRHIDNIVQNFLEFSRPPKLKMQAISPSDVVDMALQLLRHRLESYGAGVKLDRPRRLPEILGDPEQLKEVLVNLVINACEATGAGGRILISEQVDRVQPLGPVVVIRVNDNGPGVSEMIRDKLFDPFVSTKEEGTGLGLSIAARIIGEHGGQLNLEASEGQGATFTIVLPCKEEKVWVQS